MRLDKGLGKAIHISDRMIHIAADLWRRVGCCLSALVLPALLAFDKAAARAPPANNFVPHP